MKEYLELPALIDMLPFASTKMYELQKQKTHPFPLAKKIAGKQVWKWEEVKKWLDEEWEAAA